MSSTIKIAITFVVILAIIIIGWIWYSGSESVVSIPETNVTNNTQNYVDTTNVNVSTSTSSSSVPDNTTIQNMDTSAAGLQSDIDTLNTEMAGLNTDTASIDQSLK